MGNFSLTHKHVNVYYNILLEFSEEYSSWNARLEQTNPNAKGFDRKWYADVLTSSLPIFTSYLQYTLEYDKDLNNKKCWVLTICTKDVNANGSIDDMAPIYNLAIYSDDPYNASFDQMEPMHFALTKPTITPIVVHS